MASGHDNDRHVAFMDVGDGEIGKRRTVRSFVRRAGRMTLSQQRALEELWPTFGIEFDTKQLDLDTVFGRCAPRILEIGFGNGDTLVQQARDDPDSDYIGIEVHEPGIGHCLLTAQSIGITNLRLIAHDAIEVLDQQIAAASLQRINLYFPDPWPKKRHHKRRIVQPSFLMFCADRLDDGGLLHVATDWASYAEHIENIFADSGRFSCAERIEHGGELPLDRPMTKFERRGLDKGHRIWDWRFQRIT